MKRFVPAKDFCVILASDNEINISHKFSLAFAAKPLLYFSNVFGMNMIKYSGNGFIKVKASSKVYSLAFVGAIISLLIFVRPNSWKYTQLDIPLNILTKSYGTLQTFEALYSVFIVSFANSQNYVEMFQVLQKVDWHFGISKNMLGTRRVISIGLVFLPIAQTFCTFFLRKFDIRNSVSHLTFFLTMLQGSLIIFFTINIFIKYLMLNHLLIVKTSGSIPEHKNILFKGSFMGMIFKVSTSSNRWSCLRLCHFFLLGVANWRMLLQRNISAVVLHYDTRRSFMVTIIVFMFHNLHRLVRKTVII